MTPDMKFEALLVSQNVNVLTEMLDIIEDLSIDVDVCMLPSRAVDLLAKRDFDLLVLDSYPWNDIEEVSRKARDLECCRKLTVAALVNGSPARHDIIQAGVHVLLHKPLTDRSKRDFRNLVYSRMVKEWRREPRFAVRWLVAAKDSNDRPTPVTMLDISDGGVGFSYTGNLFVADVLKFQLLLPGINQIIRFDARVRWTLRNNMAGANFAVISAPDADALRNWLLDRRRVNKLETKEASCHL